MRCLTSKRRHCFCWCRRLIPDAAGRPSLQTELQEVQVKLTDMLYLLKQLPDSMKNEDGTAALSAEAEAQAPENEFLP